LYSSFLFSNEEECNCALNYLKINRKLNEDVIKFFNIGYCKKNFTSIQSDWKCPSGCGGKDMWEKWCGKDHWGKWPPWDKWPIRWNNECTKAKCVVCGAMSDDDKYDALLNNNEKKINKNLLGKIVIPIKSEFGDFLSFAARSPVAEEKGWWNQPFEKNNNLFLLNESKEEVICNGKIYIVEGYFDAIILYQYGVKNVCALMGLSLGHRRVGLLARYCNQICLCFDTDEVNKAGQIARARSIYELYQYGWTNISTISLPTAIDPDEYVIKHGKTNFLSLEKNLTSKDNIKIYSKYKKFIGKKN